MSLPSRDTSTTSTLFGTLGAMRLPIHAPIPLRPYSPSVLPEAVVSTASYGQRRKYRFPRDLTNANRRTLSFGVAAQRLYHETLLLSMRDDAATQDALAHTARDRETTAISPEMSMVPVRPSLRRSNAIRSFRRPENSRRTSLRPSESTLDGVSPIPAILKWPQPFYLGMISFIIRPSIIVSLHCETSRKALLSAASADPVAMPKRPALRRMNAVLCLRASEETFSMDAAFSRGKENAPTSPTTTAVEVIPVLDIIPEMPEEDVRPGSPPPMVAGSASSQSLSALGSTLPTKRRNLAMVFKDYWLRTCRPRPAARGRPILPTIEEDSEYHALPPLCHSFGHVMVRTKGKQVPRRPKTRRQSENTDSSSSSDAGSSSPKARTARAVSYSLPRGITSSVAQRSS
ncbi:hypothetical protein BV20DRAFT_731847 [Pilatotrama ljubarskyi]|nr:hypothetical protein BV20DRAFT_731847 [Pilatotrama ljubarskyi]